MRLSLPITLGMLACAGLLVACARLTGLLAGQLDARHHYEQLDRLSLLDLDLTAIDANGTLLSGRRLLEDGPQDRLLLFKLDTQSPSNVEYWNSLIEVLPLQAKKRLVIWGVHVSPVISSGIQSVAHFKVLTHMPPYTMYALSRMQSDTKAYLFGKDGSLMAQLPHGGFREKLIETLSSSPMEAQ